MIEKWSIGAVTVTKVTDKIVEDGSIDDFFVGSSHAKLLDIGWLRPNYITDEGSIRMSFHALVVETPSCRILVDTCVGDNKNLPDLPIWHKRQSNFLQILKDQGFGPETIDYVLCTHLHVDHVGWNTTLVDGQWMPTFPQSRYLMGRQEYDYWLEEAQSGANATDPLADMQAEVMRESIAPVFAAGLVDLIDIDHRLCPEISLVSTPGHTPGHISVRIDSEGQSALITGDFVHHPCQLAHPEWYTYADSDAALSTETREREFAALAGSETLVIGTHFTAPTGGRIIRDGEAFRLKPA